jgi:four helix bundle protein
MAHNPERLLVVQRADALVVDLHTLVRTHHRQFTNTSPGLRNQLLRAAVSISNNLGESCGHHAPRRAATLIDVAIGSCNEVERMLKLMQRLDMLDPNAERLISDVQRVRALAYGFRKRVLATPISAEAPTSDL